MTLEAGVDTRLPFYPLLTAGVSDLINGDEPSFPMRRLSLFFRDPMLILQSALATAYAVSGTYGNSFCKCEQYTDGANDAYP
jgi:hypothetical protein